MEGITYTGIVTIVVLLFALFTFLGSVIMNVKSTLLSIILVGGVLGLAGMYLYGMIMGGK